MKNKKKSILAGSILASAVMVASGFSTNASDLFSFKNLGSGEEVRASLLEDETTGKNFELKCGDFTKTKNDGKCGDKKSTSQKGKEGKCGEGKCGDSKNKKKNK